LTNHEAAAMSLDFLLHYGGRRLRQYIAQPLLDAPVDEDEVEEGPKITLDFESPLEDWQPRSVVADTVDPAALPQRFIDGCHSGETVAWLQDTANHPIPVRLAEIGGVCMRIDGRALRREFVRVERVLSLIADPFPWHEVEGFAAALTEMDLRLLPAMLPKIDEERRGPTYDFERMREQTRIRSQYEMEVLEGLALCQDLDALSLIDGRLGRMQHRDLADYDVIGVIKQQRENYLHPQGWQVLYQLEPGQRTPAFQLPSKHLPVVSWYLKLQGAQGAMPNWGIVRVEISCAHFERQRCNFRYLDRLSNALLHLRCRQGSYARAPVSLEPIVRGEESLKSLLTSPATLAQQFYHLTGL
jgi:hypothetical protein